MNISMVRYMVGHVVRTVAGLMFLPCIVALVYRERVGIIYLAVAAISLLCSCVLTFKPPKSNVFYLKEGCVTTALSWVVLSVLGCLPFIFSGEIPSFTDALFESISGFTTTGASILPDVEALTHTSLFWRSFTHWIGGMGVLVFILAILPMGNGSNINLMRAESPGPSVGKLVPRVRYTARILYILYIVLTIIEIAFLLVGRMPVFDSLCISFGTAGTGGFGILRDSLASYSPYLQWVVTIFMILFGINFNAYYFLTLRQFKKLFSMEEVRVYLIIILVSIAIITLQVVQYTSTIGEAIRHSAFQVGSIITTTGYSTVNFDLWPQASKTILVLLMFIGACAGSTGGGIKVSRLMILFKTIRKELHSFLHPKSVEKVKIDGKPVEHEVIRATNVYFITYMVIFCASVLAISFEGRDLVTNFTSVAATLNNIGPGLELVGPSGSFAFFGGFSKFVLMFDMLAGRLELFPMLLLFHPTIWRDTIVAEVKKSRIRRRKQDQVKNQKNVS